MAKFTARFLLSESRIITKSAVRFVSMRKDEADTQTKKALEIMSTVKFFGRRRREETLFLLMHVFFLDIRWHSYTLVSKAFAIKNFSISNIKQIFGFFLLFVQL